MAAIATDTDILVISLGRAQGVTALQVVHPKSKNTAEQNYNIDELRTNLGPMTEVIIFAHVFTGCDTTSAIFNKGKAKAWDNLVKSPELREIVQVFNKPDSHTDEIAAAGELFMLTLYDANPSINSLDELRYEVFSRMTRDKKALYRDFNPAYICPTSAACRQHSYRVYCKVQKCLGNLLSPTEWGWRATAGTLVPVPSLLPAAPPRLLPAVTCGCTTGCRPQTNCSCRSKGKSCSKDCTGCKGECSNQRDDGEADLDDLWVTSQIYQNLFVKRKKNPTLTN